MKLVPNARKVGDRCEGLKEAFYEGMQIELLDTFIWQQGTQTNRTPDLSLVWAVRKHLLCVWYVKFTTFSHPGIAGIHKQMCPS